MTVLHNKQSPKNMIIFFYIPVHDENTARRRRVQYIGGSCNIFYITNKLCF